MSEFNGGGDVGGSEVQTPEVKETNVAETGGETSQATKDVANEQANATGGFESDGRINSFDDEEDPDSGDDHTDGTVKDEERQGFDDFLDPFCIEPDVGQDANSDVDMQLSDEDGTAFSSGSILNFDDELLIEEEPVNDKTMEQDKTTEQEKTTEENKTSENENAAEEEKIPPKEEYIEEDYFDEDEYEDEDEEDPGELEVYDDSDRGDVDGSESKEEEQLTEEQFELIETNEETVERMEQETAQRPAEERLQDETETARVENRKVVENGAGEGESDSGRSQDLTEDENSAEPVAYREDPDDWDDEDSDWLDDLDEDFDGYTDEGDIEVYEETTVAKNTNGERKDKPEADATDKLDQNVVISNETRESLKSFEQNEWNTLTEADKECAIEQLRDCIADDLGIENKPCVKYYYKEDPEDYGYYWRSDNSIYVNRFHMGNSVETADTIAHESRHCWQFERADNPQNEQDRQFKHELENYISPTENFEQYAEQLVEVDACEYAELIRNEIPDEENSSEDSNDHDVNTDDLELPEDNSRAPPVEDGGEGQTKDAPPSPIEESRIPESTDKSKSRTGIRIAQGFLLVMMSFSSKGGVGNIIKDSPGEIVNVQEVFEAKDPKDSKDVELHGANTKEQKQTSVIDSMIQLGDITYEVLESIFDHPSEKTANIADSQLFGNQVVIVEKPRDDD